MRAITDDELISSLPWRYSQWTPAGYVGGDSLERVPLADPRIALAESAGVDLRGKRVLEPGCHEGVVTVGLLLAGAEVTAFDARLVNVVKAAARCALHGRRPHVCRLAAAEAWRLGRFDAVFHLGLLYHLTHPVAHLEMVSRSAPTTVLDTHVTTKPAATHEGARGAWWPEGDTCRAGLSKKSFWLEDGELLGVLRGLWARVELLRADDAHENGPRRVYLLGH